MTRESYVGNIIALNHLRSGIVAGVLEIVSQEGGFFTLRNETAMPPFVLYKPKEFRDKVKIVSTKDNEGDVCLVVREVD
mgnify:CR=1 FL=1